VVLSVHGSVPEEGEVIEAHGLRFVVEEVAGRRVQALRVEKILPEAPAQIEEETA
jgi:CBS domain containing-hemolysin-like protein